MKTQAIPDARPDDMEAPPLDRRLVAILAADVEAYSRAMAADEEAALAVLSAHRKVVDDLIVSYHGRIANTAGDSVLAEFSSVVDAVRCSIEIQQAIAARNGALPDPQRMQFRIGINVGDVMAKDGDIFGDGVNIAARLQSLVGGGAICVSRGVRDHIRHLGTFRFEDLGEQQVKNIDRPVRAFRIVMDGSQPAVVQPAVEEPPAVSTEQLVAETIAVDLVMWQAIANSEHVEDFLHYLERFPEGEFAALARARIAHLSQAPVASPPAMDKETVVEITFWESVKDTDNPALFEAYLTKYPDGNFALIAQARLDEFQSDAEPGRRGSVQA